MEVSEMLNIMQFNKFKREKLTLYVSEVGTHTIKDVTIRISTLGGRGTNETLYGTYVANVMRSGTRISN